MKLVSFEAFDDPQSGKHLGVLCGGGENIVDIQAVEIRRRRRMLPGLMSMLGLLHDFDYGIEIIADDLEYWEKELPPRCGYTLDEVKLLPPLDMPKSLRHVMEEPEDFIADGVVSFGKSVSQRLGKLLNKKKRESFAYYYGNNRAVIGCNEQIRWPQSSNQLDLEIELAIFIKKEGVNISEEDAMEYVGGYSLFNDLTATDLFQEELTDHSPHTHSKCFDTSNVLGPYLITKDELAHMGEYSLEVEVNDQNWIIETYEEFPVNIPKIIADISRSETLYPGDVITTGMLPNACGRISDHYLKAGDEIKIKMEPFGVLTNKVIKSV